MDANARSLPLLGRGRAHLASVGETYAQHMHFALAVGCLLVMAGIACLAHALLPGLFQDKASKAVARLHAAFERRAEAEPAFIAQSDAGGLLILLLLSFAVALMPWLGGADVGISASMSLLALGVPVAALRGAATGEDEDEEDLSSAPPALRAGAHARGRDMPAADIAIIGAGFSGTMLAAQLARAGGPRIALIECRDMPARGAAYATSHPNHLLNVRAARMSAWPDDPGHFARWLVERGLGGPYDFAPRRSYGVYLEEQLAAAKAAAGDRLSLITAEAVDVAGRAVLLDDGRRISADTIVLALGNLPGTAAGALASLPPGLYWPDPWRGGLVDGLGAEDTILLLGTGLTMIDTAIALADAGFAGRIVAASRRGLLPRSHEESQPPAVPHGYAPGLPLTRQLRAVRARAAAIGWRAAIDELRPSTNGLWQGASDEERARFLRHLRPWWDVHRHRVAPAIADRLRLLTVADRLIVRAGTLAGAEPRPEGGARVALRLRGSSYCDRFDVARIVDCTGPASDLTGTRLLRNLVAKGLIRPDPQRLGLDTDAAGTALAADGSPSHGLYALGPLTRGRAFEMTAVPELRVQAAALARALEARLAEVSAGT